MLWMNIPAGYAVAPFDRSSIHLDAFHHFVPVMF